MKKILSFLLFFFVAIIGFSQSPIKVADCRKSTLPNNGVYTVTGRTNGRIWGDGVYTDDSDLATVCVHAGILRAGETGIIQVTKKPGRSSYPSVSRNGVKSISYGAWDGSYSVALYNSNTSTSNTTTNKQSQSTTSQRNASVNAPQGPTNLKEYRNSTLPNNGVFTVTGRTNGRIWGDGVYTDDSDLATVCVHAGILRAGETGVIQVTKKPGRSSYPSVTRNGVKSISYGAWDGSYSVALYNSNTSTSNTTTNKQSQSTTSQRNASVNAPQGPTNLKEYRKSVLPNNGVFTVTGRTNGRIWGDGVYTDDSDLATVCVHAGILRAGETGVIQVTKKPGRSSYPSVTRNGVKSISYGAWDGSYSVALYNTNNATTNTANKTSQSTTSQRNASVNAPQGPTNLKEYRKSVLPNNGVFTVTGRTNGRIWGDGVYTDDSDLATVCVHAGILRAGETGVIRVTKKPGRSSYPSVSRNGVKSISYGSWDGSYSVALYNSK